MELFAPPKAKGPGGRYVFGRMYQLDDVPYGTAFASMVINRFSLSNPRSFNIQQITHVMG